MGNAKLTRSQAAAVLKLTEDDLKQRDGRDLHPQRGRDGSWLYEVSEVTALLTGAATTSATAEHDVLTAASFELFEQNVPLQRVAIQLKKSAMTILTLRKEYDALAGTISFSREHRDRLMMVLGVPMHDPNLVIDRIAALAARVRGIGAGAGAGAGASRDEDAGPDFGEVVDPATGERRGISPESAEEAVATLRARWREKAGASNGPESQPREESQPSSSALEAK
jgi:hypothetical protein